MILYHYCSNFVFHEIICNKKVRLSLLNQSNDAREGKHILDVVKLLISDDNKFKEEILGFLDRIISNLQALGFCLSKTSNSLSQWRGYAENAQGVAIGFDNKTLAELTKKETVEDDFLSFYLHPVIYEEGLISHLIKSDLKMIQDHFESGAMARIRTGTLLTPITKEEQDLDTKRYKDGVAVAIDLFLKIANNSYGVKSSFFQEEEEWRVVSLLSPLGSRLDIRNVQFQDTPEQLIPFRDFPQQCFDPDLIKEVVLGPKNQTPYEVVSLFLRSNGFENVKIIRSDGTYR